VSKVDQFESVFKAAQRNPYEYKPTAVERVMVLTDLAAPEAAVFGERVRSFLGTLEANEGAAGAPTVTWRDVGAESYDSVEAVLALIEAYEPDLICTYRSLHTEAWRWSYTLGKYVEILAHETPIPVLLLPNPSAEERAPESFIHGPPRYGTDGAQTVMALTDHLAGDHALIHWAALCAKAGGRLVLTHVEDSATFERYMDIIAKIPQIDTDTARERVQARLLKEPLDYATSVALALETAKVPVEVVPLVAMGHRLRDHVRLIEEHAVDLLVMHTKDDDQLALHGLAYSLIVELRHVPILMI
jgi:hypothetical protein